MESPTVLCPGRLDRAMSYISGARRRETRRRRAGGGREGETDPVSKNKVNGRSRDL